MSQNCIALGMIANIKYPSLTFFITQWDSTNHCWNSLLSPFFKILDFSSHLEQLHFHKVDVIWFLKNKTNKQKHQNQIHESLSNIWVMTLNRSFMFFTHTRSMEDSLQDKFSFAPPKIKASYQRDKICVKLSKCDIQVHYLCTIPVN